MHRRGKFLFFTGLFFALFFNSQNVFAYDHSIAHPGIADLAVKLYNSQNEIQITSKQAEYILQGANNEDSPIRWFNHFYDPVYNVGFSDFIFGEKLGIFPTAPVWLQSPYDQINYSAGDRSWQRAIDDYARGDEEKAFLGLGHAIHLISDMSVPAHTRNSAHPGDSYESFVKSNWSSIAPNFKYEFKEINSLQQAFADLANYSNNNFYSDRTIESEKYNVVEKVIYKKFEKDGLIYTLYKNKKNDRVIYLGKINIDWKDGTLLKENLLDPLNTNLVLTDYSQILIPQAISYSSGLIKLFIIEAEAKKAQLQYDQMSWWQKINKVLFNDDLPVVRQTVEGYVMEKTLAPAIEFGGDILDKAQEIKETVEKIAQKNQEPEVYEKLIPETKATSTTSTTSTTTTTLITSTTSIIFFSSGGGGSSYIPQTVEPTTTPEIEIDLETPTPELFLELLQTTTTNFITLNFSSSETSSLPVSFEGEYSTSTFWNLLFPWTTSTSYIFETNKSGDYDFRVRAIDGVYNTSTWSVVSTTVPMINREYIYLTGDQTEDELILTKEGSPYILDQYYYVPPEKKLIIESGAVIKSLAYEEGDIFLAYAFLDVAGDLEIKGESEDKVIFTTVYDHSFGDDYLNTVLLSASTTDEVMGGILLSVFDTEVVLDNFEMRQFERLQPHVQLASVIINEDYIFPENKCLLAENSTVNISNAKFVGCGEQGGLYLVNSQTGILNTEIISDFNAYDNGVVVQGGLLNLQNVKIKGYREYPLVISEEVVFTYEGLNFENNRVDGIFIKDLSGELILKKGEVPKVLDRDILRNLSLFIVEPGAEFYYEGLDGLSSNESLSIVGTQQDRIKIYLPDIYERAMSFNNTINYFKYVDFIGLEPYVNTGLKNSYNIEDVWGLATSDSLRTEIFSSRKRRSQGLVIRNGEVTLEQVRFINNFIPWSISLQLYNSTGYLKDVSFISAKPYGEIFYLEEARSRGINGDGGNVGLDNVNFSDLFCGIYSDPGYYYGLIKTVTTNMSESNFENVIYNFVPEDLIIFSVPEEEVITSTPEGEGVLVE